MTLSGNTDHFHEEKTLPPTSPNCTLCTIIFICNVSVVIKREDVNYFDIIATNQILVFLFDCNKHSHYFANDVISIKKVATKELPKALK